MRRLTLLTLAAALSTPLAVLAHSEALNKDGCHEGKRAPDYHCHEGALKDRRYKSKEEAEKALIREAITPKKKSSAGESDQGRDPS